MNFFRLSKTKFFITLFLLLVSAFIIFNNPFSDSIFSKIVFLGPLLVGFSIAKLPFLFGGIFFLMLGPFFIVICQIIWIYFVACVIAFLLKKIQNYKNHK